MDITQGCNLYTLKCVTKNICLRKNKLQDKNQYFFTTVLIGFKIFFTTPVQINPCYSIADRRGNVVLMTQTEYSQRFHP